MTVPTTAPLPLRQRLAPADHAQRRTGTAVKCSLVSPVLLTTCCACAVRSGSLPQVRGCLFSFVSGSCFRVKAYTRASGCQPLCLTSQNNRVDRRNSRGPNPIRPADDWRVWPIAMWVLMVDRGCISKMLSPVFAPVLPSTDPLQLPNLGLPLVNNSSRCGGGNGLDPRLRHRFRR